MRWETVIDTTDEAGFVAARQFASGDEYNLGGRSLTLLQLATDAQGEARTASWRKSNKPSVSVQKKVLAKDESAAAEESPAAAPVETQPPAEA